MSGAVVLPDARLKDRNKLAQMVDWELPRQPCDFCWGAVGGCVRCKGTGCQTKTVRLEAIPGYCQCGKMVVWVPKDNTAAIFCLCNDCLAKHGVPDGMAVMSDEAFCEAVRYEILQRFGRDVTDLELFQAKEQGQLGTALELLERESPYKLYNGS